MAVDASNNIYVNQEQIDTQVQANETSEPAKVGSTASGSDTNVFYVDVKVFLEGVQVPHMQASVSYGIDAPPTATIVIPAAQFLRNLPETTKVLITFRDILPDATGERKWRVLFDGEMSGLGYNIDSSGATLSITALHSTAYLTLLQLMIAPVRSYIYNTSPESLVGNTTLWSTSAVGPTHNVTFLDDLLKDIQSTNTSERGIKTMADIVYVILRNIVEGLKDSAAVARWTWKYLGNEPSGLKILKRIYGVSESAKNDKFLQQSHDGLKGANADASVVGSVKHPNDDPETTPSPSDPTSTQNLKNTKINADGSYTITDVYSRPENPTMTYHVLTVNAVDTIGAGGTGTNSSKIIAAAEAKIGTPYPKGDNPVSNAADCGTAVQQILQSAGYSCNYHYVPDIMRQAEDSKNLTWATENKTAVVNAKAGDLIVVGKDCGHIVIADGKGGCYDASYTEGKFIHRNSIAAAFPDIVAVINTSTQQMV